MKKILFVCTGNICRSSTAEALLRHALKGQDYEIDSCGTHDYHVGEKSDLRAILAAKNRGIDMGSIRARQINADDFKVFDHIIAMDRGHFRILEAIAPEGARDKITLFLDHSNQGIKDVPDPYYGSTQDFEKTLDILMAGMNGVVEFIKL